MSVYTPSGHISKAWISIHWMDKIDNSPEVPFEAKCAPPMRALASTVQIEEVDDEADLIHLAPTEHMSPLMQERLKRMRDSQENMVNGIVVPKKKAKAKPKAHVGTGSSSSKD